ncbi:DUF6600 domain-containing protein [Pedobacter sp. UYP1]|uniref:DUF6600 domain-containing protein n=1 Tax=Pedobacter sp. UYP1 TaxID=1756396 RepID=UPI0033940C6F
MKNMIKFPAALLGLMLLFGFTAQKSMAQGGYDDISLQSFYDELSPYGTWIQDPQYGNVWRPDVDQDDFRPYYSDGRWAMTEYGNTWVSDYDWGWAPFHYGRWVNNRFNQWVWIPDTVWGPAWVSWRSGAGYYGWAPLGPGISININIGGGGYNTPNNWWNFIPQSSIYSNNYPRYSSRNITIINRTTIINNTYGRGGRDTYYTGPRAEDIRRVTNRDVRVYNISRSERPGRTSISNNNINIYNPRSGVNGSSRAGDNGGSRAGNVDRSGRSDVNSSRAGSVDRSGRGDINTSRSGNTNTTRPDVSNSRSGSIDRAGRGDINTSRSGNTAPSRQDAGIPVNGNTDRSGRADINGSRAGNNNISRSANPDQQRQQQDLQRQQQAQQQQRDGQARQQQAQQQQRQQQDQQRQQQAQQQQRDGQARQQQAQQQQRQQQDQQRQQQAQQQQRQQQDQQRQQQAQQQQQQRQQQDQQRQQQQQQQRSQDSRSGGDAPQRSETSRSGRN